jgi:hypothetical protein
MDRQARNEPVHEWRWRRAGHHLHHVLALHPAEI